MVGLILRNGNLKQARAIHCILKKRIWILCPKGICSRVSINTLHQCPRSTVNQHSTNTSGDTLLTLHRHPGSQAMIKQMLIKYQWVMSKYRSGYQSRTGLGYRSTIDYSTHDWNSLFGDAIDGSGFLMCWKIYAKLNVLNDL